MTISRASRAHAGWGVLIAASFAACDGHIDGEGGSGAGGAGTGSAAAGTGGGAGGRAATSSDAASTGQGGAAATSATAASAAESSGSGAGGSAPSDDPCSGASDGAHCGEELGGLADHGSVYVCSGGHTASATPCESGCANGACNAVQADPCASAQYGDGAYCGGSLIGGDEGALYHCQGGATASKEDCAAGCLVEPPGVADVCKPSGDPCAAAASGNGLYCGASLGGGDPNVLYDCEGGVAASQTPCLGGCQVNPPGVADACKPAQGGGCCVARPPGVLTQAYSACGHGGSHYGVDYGTAVGTPIYAGIGGTVVGSALGFPNCYDNGCSQACWNAFNYVKIKSDCGDPAGGGDDLYVYYLHIDSLAPGVGNGSHVDQGQLVAYSGNSGCSSGPHIHIETVSVSPGAGASLSTCASVDPASRYCP